jgi:P pilus assembly chaperone PapD
VIPAGVSFGGVVVGSAKQDSVTVTNTGTSTLTISSVVSDNGEFSVTPGSGSIGPSGSQKFYVTFAPTSPDGKVGSIIFVHDASGSPDSVAVSGTGMAPEFSVAATSLTFGNVTVGSSSQDSVTVTNTGTSTLTISSVVSDNGEFSVVPGSGSIEPSGSQKFYVTFSPTSVGSKAGSIVFTHDAAGSPDTVSVAGTGVAPGFLVMPVSLLFGNVTVGSSSQDSVTVTNTGTSALAITSVMSDNGEFSVAPGNGVVAPSESQRFHITFTPSSRGVKTGNIVFVHSASGSPDTVTVTGTGVTPPTVVTLPATNVATTSATLNGTVDPHGIPANARFEWGSTIAYGNFTPVTVASASTPITFDLTGLAPGTEYHYRAIASNGDGSGQGADEVFTTFPTVPGFSVTPGSLLFGNVLVGSSKQDSVTVTNTGTSLLTISSVGSDNTEFSVVPGSGAVSPSESQSFYITFTPSSRGVKTGNIVFVHSASGSPDTVTVTGTGVTPPTVVTLPATNVTMTSATLNGTVDPHGFLADARFEWGTTTVYGNFTPVTVASADTPITFDLTGLAPGTEYHYRAIATNIHGSAQGADEVFTTIPGVPGFSVAPGSILFGNVAVGSSRQDSVTVTNTGTSLLTISSVISDNAEFSVTPAGGSINPLGSEKFYVTFSPTSAGAKSANIVFTHDAPGSPDSVGLSGSGTVTLVFLTITPDTIIAKDPVRQKFLKPVRRNKGRFPNWANLLSEVVVQGGFQPGSTESDTAGGMLVGISFMQQAAPERWRPLRDSALVRGWVRLTKWDFRRDVGTRFNKLQKTLEDRTGRHVGNARGLDLVTLASGDRLVFKGQHSWVRPKKHNNKLFAELVALKFNIAASQLGKTPVGFGELVFDMDGNPFDELSLVRLSERADTLMTYWRGVAAVLYDSLHSAVYRINRAFAGPLDTLSFEAGGKLVLNGVPFMGSVPFLKPGTTTAPVRLVPTTTLTEVEEEPDFGEDELEDLEESSIVAKLYQNFPNPFNPATTIHFRLREYSTVTMKVYDILGREVATLIDGEEFEEGFQTIELVGRDLASGIYFSRLHAEGLDTGEQTVEVGKMLLLK